MVESLERMVETAAAGMGTQGRAEGGQALRGYGRTMAEVRRTDTVNKDTRWSPRD